MSETIIAVWTSTPSPTTATLLMQNLALPIVVAVATYVLVDRLGEWRKRRMQSTLGCAVMDSLLEEVRTGIATMKSCIAATSDAGAQGPPPGRLPRAIWTGPSTISDDVLLRVLETSRDGSFPHLQPRDVRSHCKNYFEHMTANFDNNLATTLPGGPNHQNWREVLRSFLAGEGKYLEAAERVEELLVGVRQLLEANRHRVMPR